jgi:hypothetical protein
MAKRERKLIKLKDNYEETIARMRDKRAAVEANITQLRDEAESSMIEINRPRSLIDNNKRVMDETESGLARLVT